MLRQTLMCHADTGLITYDWVAGHSSQYPDFSTRHVRVPEERVVRLADNVDLAEEP
ncbi:uncharacterized protein FIBRA_09078 [Fibroporia radiculosa]|uniref:Uncharacterized protein n=1 Tax=Fibroporia radiculosa TaxID=599839 RepID=J4H5I1_9APHY|nr:uncharacterized protein FIBRA_09078 [Fibroporia radiculosa]CCM06779.1 predicted protein [Fibroporia radiculosa]